MITFSETIDKKHTGSRDSSGCLFFPPIPLFLPPQGFPVTAVFLFPHAEKCLSLQKSLMQS
jgi:hypothetical protein